MTVTSSKIRVFIPGNVPSSKNNKQWTGRYLVWSKAAQKYRKDTKEHWKQHFSDFRKVVENEIFKGRVPIRIHFLFVRKSKHKFDYPNPLQTVLDLMVEFQWIPDDNADVVLPIFDEYVYNKEQPGVYITIF